MAGYIRLVLRLILSALWVMLIVLPLFITWQLRLKQSNSALMSMAFYGGCLLWGIEVKTVGALSPVRPLLIAANHFTYLDVFALGSCAPARFITKSEVAKWPIIGFICRMGGCIFIDRRRQRTLHNMSELNYAVRQKSVMALFPESTTSEGKGLLPFKSSFFSIAEDADVTVQPVSIVYTALSGKPIDEAARSVVGWYGDAYFFPHVLRFLRERSVNVTLIFHAPVTSERFASRKVIASHCRDVIEKSLPTYGAGG